MRRNLKTRILAFLLAVIMVVGLVPDAGMTVQATEGAGNAEQTENEADGTTAAATGISLNQATAEVKAGETVTLTATVEPEDAVDKTVIWTSDNEAVATVEDGVVTAVAAGTANVTAKAGEFCAVCAVTVKAAEASKPETAVPKQKNAVAAVSNTGIATVAETECTVSENVINITDKSICSRSGKYATVKELRIAGGEVVSATEDGTKINVLLSADSATADITCEFIYEAVKVTVTTTGNTCTLSDGEGTMSVTVSGKGTGAGVKPSGSINYTIVLKCEEAGTAPVASVIMEPTETSVSETKTVKLKATVTPNDAANKKITWETSDPGIATVENGTVTGVKAGTAIITATAVGDTTKSASCTVTVTPYMETTIATPCTTLENGDACMESLTIKGPKVETYVWNVETGHSESKEHVLRVQLEENVDDSAALDLDYKKQDHNSNRPGSLTGDTTITLKDGEATVKVITKGYMDSWLGTTRNYTIYLTNKPNHAPVATPAAETRDIVVGENLEIDLDSIFTDGDGGSLTYTLTINGETSPVDADYKELIGDFTDLAYVFTAADEWGETATYTLSVNVIAGETDDVKVRVPQEITPTFSITKGFAADNTDMVGGELSKAEGTTENGFTEYTVQVPKKINRISVRGIDENGVSWGGMSFETKDTDGQPVTDTFVLRTVQGKLGDKAQQEVTGQMKVSYGSYQAVSGEQGYLLLTGESYVYQAVPGNTTQYKTTSKTEVLETGAETYIVSIEVSYNNLKKVTVTTGAKAQLFVRENYQSYKEYTAAFEEANRDGTSTFYFPGVIGESGSNMLMYRVAKEGAITKAGWCSGDVTVLHKENDASPDARIDYTKVQQENSDVAEDGVFLNINGQNNLVMSVGGTKTLKAYRVWEIIESYINHILTPDFHYNLIWESETGVVSLSDKNSPSVGEDTDWKTLKANKEGTAIIEVTYDAIEVSGGDDDGVFGATDPARTGLVVVQVGGHADVDFGIESFAGQGSLTYSEANARDWDAEFDTLYFTGKQGELKLSPSAVNGTILKVQVSHDKGLTWNTLLAEAGVYTAPIVSGNNILKVITDQGTAYQVVRGDKVEVKYKEITENGKSDGDGIVEAGETIRVTLLGLHQPIPKMSGVYNPGYKNNNDGDSSVHLNYTFHQAPAKHGGSQYDFITQANWVEVTIPSDSADNSFTLSNGYISFGVQGFNTFLSEGTDHKSHRNIPDAGLGMGNGNTTFNTRSILPDITINIGDQSSPNTAPYVNSGAVKTAQIELGQKWALNPETLFADEDGDALTFTVSVNGAEAEATDKTFTYEPDAVGTYEFVFTATDGKLKAPQHKVTLKVVAATSKDSTLTFDIAASAIKGYVTVGFEDRGIRESDAYGLKFPTPLGTIVEPTQVPFAEGDTIADVTLRLLDAKGIGYEYSGSLNIGGVFYLQKIKNFVVDRIPYDEMGQQDAGSGSGWMITSNDWFIDKGASDFLVQSGDRIQWKYTCQLGADIGDNSWEKVVGAVEKLIDAIGIPVTLDSMDKITAAREAYDELSDFYKSKVGNYNDLFLAEEALKSLIEGGATDEDKAAAAAVEALIDALGEVTLESAEKIEAAREAYDALTSLQKQLVTKLEALETAENQLKQLNSASHIEVYNATGNYLAGLGTPAVGTTGGEWMTIGLARGNKGLTDYTAAGYYNGVVQYIKDTFAKDETLKNAVRLDKSKSTENARVILGLTAAGYDATKVTVDGTPYNLFDGLDDMTYIKTQGVNGPMWALIALNAHPSYNDELKGTVTEAKLIQAILDSQLADGGWDLANQAADTDMTAMAIQALAPYYNTNPEVKNAVNNALAKLSSMQRPDGSFASIDGVNAESMAQVLVALTALGINPEEDVRFIKKGMSAVDALCAFAAEGGGFKHTLIDAATGKPAERDGMATEQGYYGLVSYFRLLNGKTDLYDMSDVTLVVGQVDENIPSAYDKADAAAVEKLIDKIGKVDIYKYPLIKSVRTAYDKLTKAQKTLVPNYQTLVDAEKTYRKQADEAVANVEKSIQKIEHWLEISLDSRSRIHTARKLYNMLPQYLRDEVDAELYIQLLGAEQIYEALQEEALALFEDGVLMLSKSELLELQERFAAVTKKTGYDEALELMRTYHALVDEQKLAFEGIEAIEILQEILAKENHEDPKTGIKAEGLEWNIRLVVKQVEKKGTREKLQKKLTDCEVLALWDISLEDVLTGEKYEPEEAIEIRLPKELAGANELYGRYAILHEMENGKLEIFHCEEKGGYLVFDAVEFSLYAVLGYEEAEELAADGTEPLDTEIRELEKELLEEQTAETGDNWVIWLALAAAGMAVLAILIALKKRMAKAAEK